MNQKTLVTIASLAIAAFQWHAAVRAEDSKVEVARVLAEAGQASALAACEVNQ